MYISENKMDWRLVYEDDVFSISSIVYRWICLKNFFINDNEGH